MADGSHGAPVLVMLPDASIRMLDSPPGTLLTAADVLKDYPGCTLGRVPDARRPPLGLDTPLKPGSTYFLFGATSPRSAASPRDAHLSKGLPEDDVTRAESSNPSTPLSRSPIGSGSSDSGWSSSSMASSTSSGYAVLPRAGPVFEKSPSVRSRDEDLSWNLPYGLDSHLRYSMPFPPRPPTTPRTSAPRQFRTTEDLCQLSLPFSRNGDGAQLRASQLAQLSRQTTYTSTSCSQQWTGLRAKRQVSVTADVSGAPLVSPRIPSPGSTIPPLPRSRTSLSPRTIEPNPILRELQELEEWSKQRRKVAHAKASSNPILAELAELDSCEEEAVLPASHQRHPRQRNLDLGELCIPDEATRGRPVHRRSCALLGRGGGASSGADPSASGEAEALRQELEWVKQQLRELTWQTQRGSTSDAVPCSPRSSGKSLGTRASGILGKLGGLKSFGRKKPASCPMETLDEVPLGQRILAKACSEKNNMPTCMDLEKICGHEETDVDFDWAPKAELFHSTPYQRVGPKF